MKQIWIILGIILLLITPAIARDFKEKTFCGFKEYNPDINCFCPEKFTKVPLIQLVLYCDLRGNCLWTYQTIAYKCIR